MIDYESRLAIIRKILWDYNISGEDCISVLEGRQHSAGHYNEQNLFIKVLESFPWYTVMDLVPLDRIRALLTEELINKLRAEQLKKRYEFIRARLSEAIA